MPAQNSRLVNQVSEEHPPPSYMDSNSVVRGKPPRKNQKLASTLTSVDLTQDDSPGSQTAKARETELLAKESLDYQVEEKLEDKLPWLQKLAKRVPCLGIMLALCASFFLGTAGMLVKMTTSVNGIQVAVFRAMIQLVVYGSILVIRKFTLKPHTKELMPVMGRALLGASSITFSYYALKLIPLGDATTIRFSLPIWTLIVSYLVLNESCDMFKIGAVIVSISGVVLIAKPDECVTILHRILRLLSLESIDQDNKIIALEASAASATLGSGFLSVPSTLSLDSSKPTSDLNGPESMVSSQQLEGSLLALASSICLSMSLIATRLCKFTPTEVIVTWLSIWSIIIGTITLLILGEWRCPDNIQDMLLIILNGACGSAGQWFITSALKVEQSGVISLARTFDIEVAFLYSALLLHEEILATSVVGSVLVSCGVIAVVLPKWLDSREQSKVATPQFGSARA